VRLWHTTDPTAGLDRKSAAGSSDPTTAFIVGVGAIASYIPSSASVPPGEGAACIDIAGCFHVVTHSSMASTLIFLAPTTAPVGHTAADADDVPSAAHRSRRDAATTHSPPADAHALRISRSHNGNDNYIRIRALRQCPRLNGLRNPDVRQGRTWWELAEPHAHNTSSGSVRGQRKASGH
jgi:hypothetical protein